MTRVRTLAIVSHVVHYRHDGALWAYGPYAREIDIWADLFPRIVIVAPCRAEQPPGDCLPLQRRNIAIEPQREMGGDTARAKAAQLFALPAMAFDLVRALRKADAIHVRCPGNLGLLGAALAPLMSRRVVAKYAGQWNGYRGEPLTVALQRRLLASGWWRGPVTVYGQWPDQPPQVIAFFTSMMTRDQVDRARRAAVSRTMRSPLRVLYAGVLTPRKRVDALVDAVRIAADAGAAIELAIVGGGPERARLEAQARDAGLTGVRFTGAVPFDAVQPWYEWADCLVLPSRHSEGWPKVVAEAMSYGVLCVAVAHGQVPAMLSGRGVLLASGDAGEIAGALRAVAAAPDAYAALARDASRWAAEYSLERLRDALAELLTRAWGEPIVARNPIPARMSPPAA